MYRDILELLYIDESMIIVHHSTLFYRVLLGLIKKWGFPFLSSLARADQFIRYVLLGSTDWIWLVHRLRLKVQDIRWWPRTMLTYVTRVQYRSQRAAVDVDAVRSFCCCLMSLMSDRESRCDSLVTRQFRLAPPASTSMESLVLTRLMAALSGLPGPTCQHFDPHLISSTIIRYYPGAYRRLTVCETDNSLQNYQPLNHT